MITFVIAFEGTKWCLQFLIKSAKARFSYSGDVYAIGSSGNCYPPCPLHATCQSGTLGPNSLCVCPDGSVPEFGQECNAA